MQRFSTFVLFGLIIFVGVYIHSQVEAVCKMPQSYRIGHIDSRFDITQEEARLAVSEAESVWEQATGNNLFTYDPQGELLINFVFDERQQVALAEENFRERLNDAENINESIRERYNELINAYNALELEYKNGVLIYEKNLDAYNAKVEKHNREGGAPPNVFEELERERISLDEELGKLQSEGRKLNGLVDEINNLSEQGNEFVENYNENVSDYNENFGESREFTQGDFQGDQINIYKFIDLSELKLVLTHELGHALSLDHVEREESMMYHLMGGQPVDMVLTTEDLDEYERVCGRTTRSWIERLMILFNI